MYRRAWLPIASLFIFVALGCNRAPSNQIPQADEILISKSRHSLTLLRNHKALRTYKVALGKGGGAPKTHEGDHLTPEGKYIVESRKSDSRFHKALHLSYPNDVDRKRAATAHLPPGGDIEIHGVQNGLGWIGPIEHWVDWTDGCIALTDSNMDAVWNATSIGTAVEIVH